MIFPFFLTQKVWIDPIHQSHNVSEKHPRMHHFVTEMCTYLLQNVAFWDMGLLHCGIYELGQF